MASEIPDREPIDLNKLVLQAGDEIAAEARADLTFEMSEQDIAEAEAAIAELARMEAMGLMPPPNAREREIARQFKMLPIYEKAMREYLDGEKPSQD